jgi:hypothetical protein
MTADFSFLDGVRSPRYRLDICQRLLSTGRCGEPAVDGICERHQRVLRDAVAASTAVLRAAAGLPPVEG